jgi:hypothetical protein
MASDEKETCPKCGAARDDFTSVLAPEVSYPFLENFNCQSWRDGNDFHESKTCTINQLTARLSAAEREVERLKSEVDGYQDAFDTQHAEIERLLGLLALTPPAEGGGV